MPSSVRGMFTSPGRIVLGTLFATIMLGTVLLHCAWAQAIHVGWFDCFFTATSTVCVTGLYTVPLAHFSCAGHVVLLFLMQIGALGLITLSVFFLSLFTTIGLTAKHVTSEALELEAGQHPRRLVMFTIAFTICIELLGMIGCYYTMPGTEGSWLYRLFVALFHSVSSFCHVGVTLLPAPRGSLVGGAGFLWITGLLVFIGSLGFVVWRELWWYITQGRYGNRHVHLSLHSTVVLATTTGLTLLAALLFFLLEYLPMFLQEGGLAPFGHALFNSLCLRSAGFTTLVMSAVPSATLLFVMIISFIGAAPGSASSGIKVTTVAIFLAAIKATLLRRNVVEMKYRTIPYEQVLKAMAILMLSIAWVMFLIFLAFITDPHIPAFDLMFEVVSFFSNVGLNRGITDLLSMGGKIVVMVAMVVGRIGSLTVLLALTKQSKSSEFQYPEERLILS